VTGAPAAAACSCTHAVTFGPIGRGDSSLAATTPRDTASASTAAEAPSANARSATRSPNRPASSSVGTNANTSSSPSEPSPPPVRCRSPDPTRRTVSPNQHAASYADNPATGFSVMVSVEVMAYYLEHFSDQASS